MLTCGPSFGAFTRIGVLLTWAAILPFFLLSCAESLETLFGPRLLLHSYQWTLLVAFLLIGPLQLRTLHQVSWLSFASSCAVILAVAVIVLALLFGDAIRRRVGSSLLAMAMAAVRTIHTPYGCLQTAF